MKFGSNTPLNKKESKGLSKVTPGMSHFVNGSLRANVNSKMDNFENRSLRKRACFEKISQYEEFHFDKNKIGDFRIHFSK